MLGVIKRLLWTRLTHTAPRWYALLRKAQNSAARLTFRQQVGSMEGDCYIAHPLYLIGPQYITVGSNFRAEPGLRIEAWDSYAGVAHQPKIVIGDGVIVNFHVHIGAIDRIEIGDNVLIGSNVLITDHSHGTTSDEDMRLTPLMRPLTSKGPVVIESNVWIGEGVCILAGVRIGHSAIIGANAVVTRDVAAGDVVGGIPAKSIKKISY